MNKFQELSHLHFRDSLPRHTVINDHPRELKSKRVLYKQVVIHRHLKSGAKDASHAFNRAVPFSGIC